MYRVMASQVPFCTTRERVKFVSKLPFRVYVG